MKTSILLFTLVAITRSALPAHARLGDSIYDLRQQYGKEISDEKPDSSTEIVRFKPENSVLEISVVLSRGRAIYQRFTGPTAQYDPNPAVSDIVLQQLAEILKPLASSWTKPITLPTALVYTSAGIAAVADQDGVFLYGNAWLTHPLHTAPSYLDPAKVAAAIKKPAAAADLLCLNSEIDNSKKAFAAEKAEVEAPITHLTRAEFKNLGVATKAAVNAFQISRSGGDELTSLKLRAQYEKAELLLMGRDVLAKASDRGLGILRCQGRVSSAYPEGLLVTVQGDDFDGYVLLSGYPEKTVLDGTAIHARVKAVGTFQYNSISAGRHTVPKLEYISAAPELPDFCDKQ